MMNDHAGGRSVCLTSLRNSGYQNSDADSGSQSEPKEKSRRRAGGILFNFICGICFVLALICAGLITFVILLGGRYDISDAFAGSNKSDNLVAMPQNETLSGLTFRLPKDVKPIHYDLYLFPDLMKGTFKGNVTIAVDLSEIRDYICLHQKDLNIISTKVVTIGREKNWEIEIQETYAVEKLETWVIAPKKEFQPGLYNVTLEFEGALQPDKIVGFYSSTYKDELKRTRSIATSKFEPTYARRAFPCFDEPGFKAEFSIKVVQPAGDGYTTLSNMNVQSAAVNKPEPGLTTVTFAKSVPMSTYLACFIVSDFVAVTEEAKGLAGRTFPVSVYTTRAQQSKGAFALNIGVKAIEYYINLFNIDYPLPKLDMAAIPDFVSGAMENWGLVTYREARLLYDSAKSSTANKKSVVTVVCHEFAHMWFGNLVTMAWWNDLWLNEGFATYMQFKSSDAILPEWGMMDQFLVDLVHPVFKTDATLSSHPIVQTVSNPDEITAIFDVISYNKGASILRMLDNFIGSDIFYAGITKYLNQYAYQNAETSDLFFILQNAVGSNLHITAIMDTWTRQMGFPVVNVVRNGDVYTLTQKRFLADPKATYNSSESNYGYKWTIPITYTTSASSKPTLVWFDKHASSLSITLDKSVQWIKLNKDQIGYYRVNYEKAEWMALSNVLQYNHKTFSASDRTHLLEDAFSLADATELDYDIAMDMTAYLVGETHFVPWKVAASKLSTINFLLASTDLSTRFRTYVKNLVNSTYEAVTWTVGVDESHVTLRLRTTILKMACGVGHAQCLTEAGKLFTSWINDPYDNRPHPDVRSLIYYYGMNSVGGEAEWNTMFDKFVNETDSTEKLKLMYGLAGIKSVWILNKFINLAIDEKYVRSQDYFTCINNIAANPVGAPLVWDWIRENWEILVKRYTLNNRYLGQLIPGISYTFSTQLKLDEMLAFFAKYPEAGAGASYRAQALETVSNNIKWLKNNSGKLDSWLKSHQE
ncbi:glutamyl aminopeptidase-like isoform X1 [Neodiprion fabricii]|uniref:glutamyl aminopeptidase-like isoform X1 n=1 Tax=Neodiprion fabricii TaxID=2872261 RepID=UPI001ED8D88C|nr:glutamyl aminopeptidase-like isoform X1 [Neodiprion fabricii]XP_046435910.1 glutamyl aminopeptidase-like isoform X1 [Neodiprion fabricii]XP_046435911.1 glutamyl aminopeptidase-like isoform X1 [Neodiprion fabricii]